MSRLRSPQRLFLLLAHQSYRDVLGNVRQNLAIVFAVPDICVIALQSDYAEYFASVAQRNAEPVDAILADRLDFMLVFQVPDLGEVSQQGRTRSEHILGKPFAKLAARGLGIVF